MVFDVATSVILEGQEMRACKRAQSLRVLSPRPWLGFPLRLTRPISNSTVAFECSDEKQRTTSFPLK